MPHCRVHILLAGYGFVARAAADLLCAAGHKITALRRQPDTAQADREVIACDLRHDRPWNSKKQFDAVVFSLAPDERSYEAYKATYCTAQENLLMSVEAQHYIYISSTAVYPESQGRWRETDAVAHSESAELLLEAETIAGRIETCAILRFAGLYNRDRRIYYGPPVNATEDRLVHFLHRADAARVISHAIAHGLKGVYNVHDGNPQWRSEIFRRLGFLSDPPPRTVERCISADKLFATGFRPTYPDYFTGLSA